MIPEPTKGDLKHIKGVLDFYPRMTQDDQDGVGVYARVIAHLIRNLKVLATRRRDLQYEGYSVLTSEEKAAIALAEGLEVGE